MISHPTDAFDGTQPFDAWHDEIFRDERAARKHLKALRWPDGAYCPHCLGRSAVHALGGKCADEGIHFCAACRRKFTVRVGTIYERSHIPLNKWMLATFLLCSSKKGMSAHQLHHGGINLLS